MCSHNGPITHTVGRPSTELSQHDRAMKEYSNSRDARYSVTCAMPFGARNSASLQCWAYSKSTRTLIANTSGPHSQHRQALLENCILCQRVVQQAISTVVGQGCTYSSPAQERQSEAQRLQKRRRPISCARWPAFHLMYTQISSCSSPTHV